MPHFEAKNARQNIVDALRQSTSQRQAAKLLGIPESTFRLRMSKLEIISPFQTQGRKQGLPRVLTRKRLLELSRAGYTLSDVATLFDVSSWSLRQSVQKFRLTRAFANNTARQSLPEFLLSEELRSLGFTIQEQFPVGIGFGDADLYVKELGLVIEYDGCWSHSSAKQQERDQAKSEYIRDTLGLRLVRIRGEGLEVTHPDDVATAVPEWKFDYRKKVPCTRGTKQLLNDLVGHLITRGIISTKALKQRALKYADAPDPLAVDLAIYRWLHARRGRGRAYAKLAQQWRPKASLILRERAT